MGAFDVSCRVENHANRNRRTHLPRLRQVDTGSDET